MLIRLNKYLSDCGIASRRKAEEYILQGRVFVNKKQVKQLFVKIDPEKDVIKLDGEIIKGEKKVYFLMNKPKGVITSTRDEKGRQTVVDLIKTNIKIFPVGRLDYNTTGILILTNDGDFSNYITHPKNKFIREYKVNLDKPLKLEDENKLLDKIYLDGKKGKFLSIEFPSFKNRKIVVVKTNEGRNHFVKRMFGAVGYTVKKLHRISFAGISANNIENGKYKQVSLNELKKTMSNNF